MFSVQTDTFYCFNFWIKYQYFVYIPKYYLCSFLLLGLDLRTALEEYELLFFFFPGSVTNLRPKYSLVVVHEVLIVKGQLQGCKPIYLFFSLGFTEKDATVIWWFANMGEKRINNVVCSMPNLESARLVLVTNGLKLLLLGYFILDK